MCCVLCGWQIDVCVRRESAVQPKIHQRCGGGSGKGDGSEGRARSKQEHTWEGQGKSTAAAPVRAASTSTTTAAAAVDCSRDSSGSAQTPRPNQFQSSQWRPSAVLGGLVHTVTAACPALSPPTLQRLLLHCAAGSDSNPRLSSSVTVTLLVVHAPRPSRNEHTEIVLRTASGRRTLRTQRRTAQDRPPTLLGSDALAPHTKRITRSTPGQRALSDLTRSAQRQQGHYVSYCQRSRGARQRKSAGLREIIGAML